MSRLNIEESHKIQFNTQPVLFQLRTHAPTHFLRQFLNDKEAQPGGSFSPG